MPGRVLILTDAEYNKLLKDIEYIHTMAVSDTAPAENLLNEIAETATDVVTDLRTIKIL